MGESRLIVFCSATRYNSSKLLLIRRFFPPSTGFGVWMSVPSEVPHLHPGVRIKAEVIPPGMSVTKAAQLMGVGRPALSNLLNGNAALSAEMAARLEKAFKYP